MFTRLVQRLRNHLVPRERIENVRLMHSLQGLHVVNAQNSPHSQVRTGHQNARHRIMSQSSNVNVAMRPHNERPRQYPHVSPTRYNIFFPNVSSGNIAQSGQPRFFSQLIAPPPSYDSIFHQSHNSTQRSRNAQRLPFMLDGTPPSYSQAVANDYPPRHHQGPPPPYEEVTAPRISQGASIRFSEGRETMNQLTTDREMSATRDRSRHPNRYGGLNRHTPLGREQHNRVVSSNLLNLLWKKEQLEKEIERERCPDRKRRLEGKLRQCEINIELERGSNMVTRNCLDI